MDIVDTIKKVIQEFILPEFETIKAENKEIKTILELTNKRIDDVNERIDDINTHLVDQSRRIDETNKRIDGLDKSLNSRIDEMNKRIDELRVELRSEIAIRINEMNNRIDETNKRIDRLYEVIVRREEHERLDIKVMKIEQDIAEMKKQIQTKIAA